MRESNHAHQPMPQRRIRRCYLILVFGCAGTLALLGATLGVLGVVPVARAVLRPAEPAMPEVAVPLLIGAAALLVIAAKLVALSGLELSVWSVKVKASLDSTPSEALLTTVSKPVKDMTAPAIIGRFEDSFRDWARDVARGQAEQQIGRAWLRRARRHEEAPQPTQKQEP